MALTYKQALKYLQSLEGRGSKLGLERIEKEAKKAGNPQKALKIIHVAGTNGKGSVSAMLSSILTKAGYKVGLYTSPHLVKVNERIRINDNEISNKEFAKLVEQTKKITDRLTYFEFLTLMALLHFKQEKVNYAILEVGLGGRLDATNISNALVAVITSIGIEHTKQLGNTIKKIAGEKAAIIKKNSIAITGEKGKALQVIKKFAEKGKARLVVAGKTKLKSNLKGKFQEKNLNLAVQVTKELQVPDEAIKQGLQNVKWQGRLHFVRKNLLLDCAHNPAAMESLAKELKDTKQKKILVIGILKEKNYKKILRAVVPLCSKVIIVKANNERALEPEMIAREIKKLGKQYEVIPDIKKGVERATKLAKDKELVVVTGSIYVVGDALKITKL